RRQVVAELVVPALERRPRGVGAEDRQRSPLDQRLEPPVVGALGDAEALAEAPAAVLARGRAEPARGRRRARAHALRGHPPRSPLVVRQLTGHQIPPRRYAPRPTLERSAAR